ncbi:peptidase S41 [Candidatus Viridilinea mediisalina]|uniref:Tricorn protease homolog n=2 Tax=Candidatus Viridilinea mediisalina TaxID=2024553 RepID=A0A2A6RKQ4_9CHLR|nr:peptidase S41 [Candidatus Viridilinea mediisalina]
MSAIDPDGRWVAFVHAGDLWLVDAAGGVAERLTAHPASHYSPRFSPDGRQLAFTSNRSGSGDVYLLPLHGGTARQLTFHDARHTVEDWTPDGSALYVSSGRDQCGTALYRVGLEGMMPTLLYAEPYEQLGQLSVAPDGVWVAFSNMRERWWRRGPNPFAPGEIWLGPTDPDENALRLIAGPGPVAGYPQLAAPYAGRNAWPLWAADGRGIYFVSDRDGNENLWYQPLDGGLPKQITFLRDGRLLHPQIARNAGLIVFEREGQIWRCDLETGEVAPTQITARGDGKVMPVRYEHWQRGFSDMRLSPDGKKVAFVARGEIFADFADKETDRELRQGPSFRVTDTRARERQPVWTPNSRTLLYVSDRHGEDEIYRYDFVTRQEQRLTHDLQPKQLPRVSPDGTWLAYLSGHDRVQLLNLVEEGAEVRELCRARFVVAADLAWSPNSRWLAYIAQDERFFSNVYIVPVEGGTPRQITFLSNLDGGDLLWAPNGQFIIFTTEHYRAEAQIVRVDLLPPHPLFREAEFEKLFQEKKEKKEQQRKDEGAPEPEGDEQPTEEAPEPEQGVKHAQERAEFERLLAGIERRLRFLTPIQMDATAAALSPDSKELLFTAIVAGKLNLWALPLDEPRADHPPRQLTASESSKYAVQFAPDGKTFFYLEDGVITMRKFPSGNDPVRVHVRAEVTVDFHAEKLQIFGEAWRALRDSFYDPTFRGQDWNALRERFAPWVAGVQTTGELHSLINLMVGELRTSHLGIRFGAWMGSDGYTGIMLDAGVLRQHGHARIERIIPDSPAALVAQPPVAGEYLCSIDGTALGPGVSLDQLLRRSVGRRVRLGLAATPSGTEVREVDVRPVDAATYWQLRYRDWVHQNEAYVHRVSQGRLGYVHIDRMSYPAYQQFLADLDAEAHGKDGVIVDVRYNGGGHTATFILDVLTRRSSLLSGFRERATLDASHLAGNRVLNRPTVLITNERSASNTEMLSESYRRLGLGRVVGRPTAGAVIWAYTMRLLDGAGLRLPRLSVVTPEGEDLEGRGRPVDVEVARPLGEWNRGRDRQLDAAVEVLLGK